jgi:hypothetical protein
MAKASAQTAVQLRLSGGAGQGAVASAARKRFDSLLRRLENCRTTLAAWSEALPRWHERYQQQVVPLYRQRDDLDLALLQLLDHAHGSYKLGKAERGVLSELIREGAGALIARGHEELKPLYDRYGSVGYDAEQAGYDALFRQLAAAEFGLDADQLQDADTAEALFERLRERADAQQAHARERQQRASARKAQRKSATAALAPPPPLRELYRKLATALHPDRERDPGERERKTALMQRLNRAYAAGNLLELIELQLEIGQLQPEQLRQLDDARIKDYNRELNQQLGQIERELEQVEIDFCEQYGLLSGRRFKPERLDAVMAQVKRELGGQISALQGELSLLQDAAAFKRWLKQQRQQAEGDREHLGGFATRSWE